MVTEDIIVRVASALSFGVSVEELYTLLKSEGFSEYDTFLACKAGEVYNTMSARTYVENV